MRRGGETVGGGDCMTVSVKQGECEGGGSRGNKRKISSHPGEREKTLGSVY